MSDFEHRTETTTIDQDAFRKQLCVEIAAGIYRSCHWLRGEGVGEMAVETLQGIEKALDDEKEDQPSTQESI